MKNIKIGQRLMGGFAAVLLITVAVTVAASLAMGRVRDDSAKITGDCLPGMERIGRVRATSEGQIGRVKVAVLANDARQRAAARSEAADLGSQNGALLDEYEKTVTSAEDRALFNTVKDRRRDWVAARTGIFALLDQHQEQAAVAALESTGQPAFEAYIKVVRELFDFNKRNGEEAGQAIASSVRSVSLVLWLGMGATLILGFGIAMVIGRSMTGPVGVLVEYVERAAAGDLGRECGYDGQDEIGILSQRLTKMSSDLGQAREGERTRAEQDRKDQAELQRRVDAMLVVLRSVAQGDLTQTVPVKGSDAVGQLGEAFESLVSDLNRDMTAISRNAQALAAAAEELTATSQQMAANSEETSVQAASVSAGSEQVSHSVQSVSAATEQMTASIREIAKNAQDATGVATSAVNMAESTNATMAKLSASSEEIGKVVKVITSIAEQTNLLALNATIEAARAGAAGKGFAVVANEVKELAKETAKATEEISAKIGAMQSDAGQAVLAIQEIRTVIGQVNNISSTIASAVEEQTATTNEIGRNVSQAAQGSTDIARNIAGVASAAKGVAVGATDSQTASNSLSQMANELQGIVAKFKLGADRSAGRHGAPALSSSLSRNGGAAGHASQSSVA